VHPQLVEDALPISELLKLPTPLENVIMSCIERDPARRPGSAIARCFVSLPR
jgi:hypothetical protein